MTDNLPEKAATPGQLATNEDPWAELRDAFDDGSQGFTEHFGTSLPRLRSDFGRNGKGWIDDLTNEVFDHLRIGILAYPISRQYWLKGIDEGEPGPPDCRSLDMLAPLADSPAVQSDLCGRCKHSQWTTTEDGARQRPGCQESVNVIAYLFDQDVYAWLRFAGTALRPFRNYISALKSRRLPAFAVMTEITLETAKRDRLEWLVPKFEIGDHLSPEQVAPMREIAKLAMETFGQVTEEMAAAERKAESTDPFNEADPMNVANQQPVEDLADDITDAEIVEELRNEPLDGSTQVVNDGTEPFEEPNF
jgi:hypothetical protein